MVRAEPGRAAGVHRAGARGQAGVIAPREAGDRKRGQGAGMMGPEAGDRLQPGIVVPLVSVVVQPSNVVSVDVQLSNLVSVVVQPGNLVSVAAQVLQAAALTSILCTTAGTDSRQRACA